MSSKFARQDIENGRHADEYGRRNRQDGERQHSPQNNGYNRHNKYGDDSYRQNRETSTHNNYRMTENSHPRPPSEQFSDTRYSDNAGYRNNGANNERDRDDTPENRYNKGLYKNNNQRHPPNEGQYRKQHQNRLNEENRGENRAEGGGWNDKGNRGPVGHDFSSRSNQAEARRRTDKGERRPMREDQADSRTLPPVNSQPGYNSRGSGNQRHPKELKPRNGRGGRNYEFNENKNNSNRQPDYDDHYDNRKHAVYSAQDTAVYHDSQTVRRGDDNSMVNDESFDELDENYPRNEEYLGARHNENIGMSSEEATAAKYGRGNAPDRGNDGNIKERQEQTRTGVDIVRESDKQRNRQQIDDGFDEEGKKVFTDILMISQRFLARFKAFSETAEREKSEIEKLEMKNKQLEISLEKVLQQENIAKERIEQSEKKLSVFKATQETKEAKRDNDTFAINERKVILKVGNEKLQYLKNQLLEQNLKFSELKLDFYKERREADELSRERNIQDKRETEETMRRLNRELMALKKETAYRKGAMTYVFSKAMLNYTSTY